MNLLKSVTFSLLTILSLSASASQIGQKCRPLGPFQARDTVDKIAPCFCESGALIAGAAFQGAGSEGYRPEDIREWSQPDKRKKLVVWIATDSNFVTLVASKDLGQENGRNKKQETYAYYQSADRESGAEQLLLGQVVINVDTPSDGNGFTNCSVISASAAP